MAISRPTITVSVRCAVFTTGSRNALTPLLTASTPIMSRQPLANALRASQMPIVAVAAWDIGGREMGVGWPGEATVLYILMTVMVSSVRTNAYVGTMNAIH